MGDGAEMRHTLLTLCCGPRLCYAGPQYDDSYKRNGCTGIHIFDHGHLHSVWSCADVPRLVCVCIGVASRCTRCSRFFSLLRYEFPRPSLSFYMYTLVCYPQNKVGRLIAAMLERRMDGGYQTSLSEVSYPTQPSAPMMFGEMWQRSRIQHN